MKGLKICVDHYNKDLKMFPRQNTKKKRVRTNAPQNHSPPTKIESKTIQKQTSLTSTSGSVNVSPNVVETNQMSRTDFHHSKKETNPLEHELLEETVIMFNLSNDPW